MGQCGLSPSKCFIFLFLTSLSLYISTMTMAENAKYMYIYQKVIPHSLKFSLRYLMFYIFTALVENSFGNTCCSHPLCQVILKGIESQEDKCQIGKISNRKCSGTKYANKIFECTAFLQN